MRSRLGPLFTFVLLVVVVFSLAGCEKDRPAPPLLSTPSGRGGDALTPGAASGTPGVDAGTPVPLVSGTPAPPTPQPLVEPTNEPGSTGSETSDAVSDDHFAYTVVAGDSLGSIAEKFAVDSDAILSLNSLANPDVLSVGQELKIPGQPPAGYDGTGSYVVRSGDTLFSIALHHGVTLDELQELNSLADVSSIYVGQVLRIPEGAGTGAPAPDDSTQTTSHVVQAGETLFSIALRYNTTLAVLQELNNISNPDQVYLGQALRVPAAASAAPTTPASSQTHTVQTGDTLFSIALQYGVTTAALQSANNITDPNQIRVGQVLRIP